MDSETTVRTGEAYVSGALAALDDEHDRHGVLAGELDFDSDTE